MKLSAHHSTHGLEGTVRLLDTGETLHLRFPKGKFRAEAQVNIGGHRLETAFLLEMVESKRGEDVDMRIVLEAPIGKTATGTRLAPVPAPKAEVAGDGSPMTNNTLRQGPPPSTKHLVSNGLPPGPTPEEPPREPTPREKRSTARLEALEKMVGEPEVVEEKPKGGKKKAAARAKTPAA